MTSSNDTLNILHISEVHSSDAAEVDVNIDEYVPLRFRTYREPLGVGYIRLGNYSTTLVELALEPRTQVVRGLTVTSVNEVSPWPAFDVLEVVNGLPAVSASFEGGEVVDLRHDFRVATRSGEVVVFWRDLTRCKGYRLGNTCFLVADETLAGVWFTKLNEADTKLFASHAGGT